MKKNSILSAATALFLLGNINFALAMESLVPCGPGKGNMCTLCDFVLMAKNIFDFLLKISLAAAILFVAIAGILYIVSSGSENLMTLAKSAMTYALVGFGLCLTAWLLVHIVASMLGYKENWWKLEMNCEGFGLAAQEDRCKNSGGELDPDTGECECTKPNEERYHGKCTDKNLIAKIEACIADPNKSNQSWDYNKNFCNCANGYFRNDNGDCVDIKCWDCTYRWLVTHGENAITCLSPCKTERVNAFLYGCVPGNSCGTITLGAPKTPCGTEPGSTCQENCQPGGWDLGGTSCNKGQCCKKSSTPKVDPETEKECLKCTTYSTHAAPYPLQTEGPECTQHRECLIETRRGMSDQCIPNPAVCK